MAEKALALWLADALELHYAHLTAVPEINRRAAAELRRLHEENTKLAQLLADTHDVSADLAETSDALHRTLQQRDELLEACKEAEWNSLHLPESVRIKLEAVIKKAEEV